MLSLLCVSEGFWEIFRDDIDRAVKKLKLLGDGFEVVRVGSRMMIQSLPRELSSDHTTVLLFAQDTSYVTVSQLRSELKWPDSRIELVLVRILTLPLHYYVNLGC